MTDIRLEDLRGEMRELAAVIGVEQTLELCSLFAGDNLYIPTDGKELNGDIKELREVLGEEIYSSLQLYFGGGTIYFPTKSTVLKEYIARKIRSEYDGTNRRRLMREYGLTKNSFYRLLEGMESTEEKDDTQMTLFDLDIEWNE